MDISSYINSIDLPESTPNLTTGKLIGPCQTRDYLHQTASRGEPDYVMSRTELLEFDRCPMRWRNGYKRGDTDSTEFGTLVDLLFLTPELALERIAVAPETYTTDKGEEKPWNWNAGVCRAFAHANEGKLIVKTPDYLEASRAVHKLWGDSDIAKLVFSARTQQMLTAQYRDEATGLVIPVKTLIDLVPADIHALADLKTARNAHRSKWPRDCFEFGYHVQAALNLDIWNCATGEERTDFYHVIVENVAPYQTAKRLMHSDFINLGRHQYQAILRRYAQCLASGVWTDYEAGGEVLGGWGVTRPEGWMAKEVMGE